MTTSPIAKALGYCKFKSVDKPRMLIMKSNYFVNDDVVSSAKDLGWDVFELATNISGITENSYLQEMLISLMSFRPDFVLTINQGGFDPKGILAGILNQFNIPLASWFVDHPLTILADSTENVHSNTQIFCIEKTAIPWLKSIGFEDPKYLATASNPKIFHPSLVHKKAELLGKPLAFVGGSWWQRARETSTPEINQLAKKMMTEHTINGDYLRNNLQDFLDSVSNNDSKIHYAAFQQALAESSMSKRASFITALKELHPVVYGDKHWQNIVNDVELLGPVHGTTELPSLFAGSKVNLNITAEQMPTAVNQRVWDVPGIGGFLLTDAQEDVLENFEDAVDVAVYNDLDEAKDKARFYLENDRIREKIAEKGLAKIDKEHRINHRLQNIEKVMRKRFG